MAPTLKERGRSMRGKSHRCLGNYLVQHYMKDAPARYVRAFLIGCIEPDRNPATYLKGSIRAQLLRGHNYRNARRFMRRISQRLEAKDNFGIFDYYTLGKLIHYTTDAFTYAHNEAFPTNLEEHRVYEATLQDHFLAYMAEDPQVNPQAARSIMDALYRYHLEYESQGANIDTDSRFALTACCCVVSMLAAKPLRLGA